MTRPSIALALLATVAQYGALTVLAHDVAHAESLVLQCNGFMQNFGYAGRNPPNAATVVHNNDGWDVHYTLVNGQDVNRNAQFTMTDNTDNTQTQWSGWLKKNNNKWMRGRIMKRNADGHLIYLEELFDQTNKLLASNTIDCGVDTRAPVVATPAPAPAPVAPVPSSTGSPFAAPVAPAGMSYDYEIKGESLIIHAKGVISYDEAKIFNAFHETWKDKPVAGVKYTVLSLDSPGGNIWGAKVMADWVKKYNVSTIVANDATCASACVLVWGAGAYKAAGVTSHIGVHNASVSDPSFSAADKHAAEAEGSMNVIKTLAAEGAPAAVIAAAAVTENDDVHWLKTADIKGWNVTIVDKDGKAVDDTPPAPAPQPQTAAANQSGLLQ